MASSSRAFSSSHAARLMWKKNGTTANIDKYIARVETAVAQFPPELFAKAPKGIVNGDPHITPSNNEPMHVAGVIGARNMKSSSKLTLFHALEDGRVKFANPKLQMFNQPPDWGNPPASSTYFKSDDDWQWDDEYGMRKIFYETEWVFWDDELKF